MQITLLRHAESEFNVGISDEPDVDLTDKGRLQAASLTGHYDLVLCSPLRRCLETLTRSNITYDEFRIEPLLREQITNQSDLLPGETFELESEEHLLDRIEKITLSLKGERGSILLVTHSDFIWYWSSHLYESERFGKHLGNAETYISS